MSFKEGRNERKKFGIICGHRCVYNGQKEVVVWGMNNIAWSEI